MISYKDKIWCSDAVYCKNNDCELRLTDEEHNLAVKWWKNQNYPAIFSSFRDTCEQFIEIKDKK
jgi:hypothetical protein